MSEDDAVPDDVEWEEIDRRIGCAVRQLQEADGFLLVNDANERTITHRLAMYLEPHFPRWDVDVEYNRKGAGETTKVIPDWEMVDWERIADGASRKKLLHDLDARTVYPDIIVHQRGRPKNLLAVEVKKAGRSGEVDRWKLQIMRDEAGLNYRHAVFLQLPAGENPDLTFTLEPVD